ncbi:hypothetical protein ACIBTV_05535 [Micromonospora sp. NPDC049366]|uniref:hypothetical protein n=1 Tax=Micromonospora sp. NPDC049366 TaxID=3364271 RepID=UPI0037A39AF0
MAPTAQTTHPSPTAGATAGASMTVTYQQPGAPEGSVPQGMIHQTIFTFAGDGAADTTCAGSATPWRRVRRTGGRAAP